MDSSSTAAFFSSFLRSRASSQLSVGTLLSFSLYAFKSGRKAARPSTCAVLRFSGAWSAGSTHRSGGRGANRASKFGGSLSVIAAVTQGGSDKKNEESRNDTPIGRRQVALELKRPPGTGCRCSVMEVEQIRVVAKVVARSFGMERAARRMSCCLEKLAACACSPCCRGVEEAVSVGNTVMLLAEQFADAVPHMGASLFSSPLG